MRWLRGVPAARRWAWALGVTVSRVPSPEDRATWLITTALSAILAGLLIYEHGIVGGLYVFTGFLFGLSLFVLAMRFVLALGWGLRFLRRFELLALPYCAAYLLWCYASGEGPSIPYVAAIGISTGLFLGLFLLFSASRLGKATEALETRLLTRIVKKFRRDDNAP